MKNLSISEVCLNKTNHDRDQFGPSLWAWKLYENTAECFSSIKHFSTRVKAAGPARASVPWAAYVYLNRMESLGWVFFPTYWSDLEIQKLKTLERFAYWVMCVIFEDLMYIWACFGQCLQLLRVLKPQRRCEIELAEYSSFHLKYSRRYLFQVSLSKQQLFWRPSPKILTSVRKNLETWDKMKQRVQELSQLVAHWSWGIDLMCEVIYSYRIP